MLSLFMNSPLWKQILFAIMGLLVIFAPVSAQQINRDENDIVPELGTSLISAAVTNLNTKL